MVVLRLAALQPLLRAPANRLARSMRRHCTIASAAPGPVDAPPLSPLSLSAPMDAAASSTVRLHFAEAGNQLAPADAPPPLVVLHGLLGAGGNFRTWATRLHREHEPSRRILLVDLRNHGNSIHSESMRLEEMAADVLRLLDENGIERAAVCGHSLGGKVAMMLALLHPRRVERLVVLDIAPVKYGPGDGSGWAEACATIRAMRGVDVGRATDKKDAEQSLSRAISDPALRAFVLMNLARRSGGGLRWRVNLDAIDAALPQLADWPIKAGQGVVPYGGNTLFVGGGRSRYVRSSHLETISSFFSRFSVTTVRSAAHWIHADEPDALLLIAANFLAVPCAGDEECVPQY